MKRMVLLMTGFFLLIGCTKETVMLAQASDISLPTPKTQGDVSLEETILKRRSVRSFSKQEISMQAISQLLWSAQGITERRGNLHLRSAPSAGALYPVETYLLTKDGFFHYHPLTHQLTTLSTEDLRKSLAGACLGQAWLSDAAAVIVLCGVPERIMVRYGHRGIRYLHMEIGHIAQNVHLQAVALGMDSVPIGAFDDDQVKSLLNLPENQTPLYVIPVGYAR